MDIIDERTLLHLKHTNDAADAEFRQHPSIHPAITGASVKIVARTLSDGRVRIVGSVSRHMLAMRGSGKIYGYYKTLAGLSIARTKQDLVVLRRFQNEPKKTFTQTVTQSETGHDAEVLQSLLSDLTVHYSYSVSMRSDDGLRVLEGPRTGVRTAQEIRNDIQPLLPTTAAQAAELLGALPVFAERYPLLPELRVAPSERALPGWVRFFADAQDFRQVAGNLFGKTRVTRPLTREITSLLQSAARSGTLFEAANYVVFLRQFRGLVPTDWITERIAASARDTRFHFNQTSQSKVLPIMRELLRRVPAVVLRRVLAERPMHTWLMLADACNRIGPRECRRVDLDLLPELIAARGQKNLRGTQDLENLVLSMPENLTISPKLARSNRAAERAATEAYDMQELRDYNEQAARLDALPTLTWEQWHDGPTRDQARAAIAEHRRELMTIRQREEQERRERERQERLAREKVRTQWAEATTKILHGIVVDGYTVTVAKTEAELSLWGQTLHNCIGGYARSIGLDLLVAVHDASGKLRLNLEINMEQGLRQMLGTNNRDAVKELGQTDAQKVLDIFVSRGIPAEPSRALGLNGLRVLEPVAAAS